MTVVRRIVAALRQQTRVDAGFTSYYSRLLRAGDDGVPSAHEARQDLNEMRVRNMAHRYL